MEARVVVRYAHIAVRKARAMVNLVRGNDAGEALTMLRFTNKAAAKIITKALDSAVANAKQKSATVNVDKLYVKTAFVDKGPMKNMRRWRPRAMGRATRVVKGLSHITIVLDERD